MLNRRRDLRDGDRDGVSSEPVNGHGYAVGLASIGDIVVVHHDIFF